jgi:hypothetical protein
MHRCYYWAAVLLVVAAWGCGPPKVTFAPVEGVVSKGGKPLARVQVLFLADGDTRGPRAIGIADAEGRYRLHTDAGQEGAPVGRHRVCLLDVSASPWLARALKRLPRGAEGKVPPLTPNLDAARRVPPAYGRPEDTPLRAEVRPGPQTIDFKLP